MSQSDGSSPARRQSDTGARASDGVDTDGSRMLDGSPVGRRTLMKGIGASTAGAVALGSDYGMVDESEAIAPIIVGGAIVGAAVVGWAVREYEVVGQNPPAEGLTAGALQQDVYQTALTRKSTNASTFVDNRNIINMGLPNSLYVEGKLAAIEQLNQQAAKADVEQAAHDAMNKYAATIEENLLKSWNESVREFRNLLSTIETHPETNVSDLLTWGHTAGGTYSGSDTFPQGADPKEETLSDGSSFMVEEIHIRNSGSYEEPDGVTRDGPHDYHYDPFGVARPDDSTTYRGRGDGAHIEVSGPEDVEYLRSDQWMSIWSDLQTTISNVQSGLTTWVTNAYDQVQAGEIEISELITPRERAQMIAADDGAAQAIADLMALNIPVDAGNNYTITMADTGATLRGTLAVTDDSQSIESGSTYNPNADTFSGDAFFTYNVATGSGDWSAYEESIDGGVATFTEAPYEKTQYELTTSHNETVTVTRDNFTAVDSSGNPVQPHNSSVAAWEVDLSQQLENDIANVKEVDFFADVDESRMETIKLDSQFTVEKIVNAESNEEVDSASFESAEPQTDSNYITQEQWTQLQQQNQELIEKFEESQNTGGGGIDLSQFDMFGLPGELVALAGGAVALLIGANK